MGGQRMFSEYMGTIFTKELSYSIPNDSQVLANVKEFNFYCLFNRLLPINN